MITSKENMESLAMLFNTICTVTWPEEPHKFLLENDQSSGKNKCSEPYLVEETFFFHFSKSF